VFDNAGRPGYDGVVAALMQRAEGHPQGSIFLAHLLWQRAGAGAGAGDRRRQRPRRCRVHRRTFDGERRYRRDAGRAAEDRAQGAAGVAEYGTPLSSRALRDLNLAKPSAQSAASALLDRALVERPAGSDEWRVADPFTARWPRSRYPTARRDPPRSAPRRRSR
jgi:hypothetical protein